jgi:hypothetical protein
MKVYLNDAQREREEADSTAFAGTFPAKEVELTDELIDHCGLRKPLEKLMRETLQHLNEHGRYEGRVRAADVFSVSFNLYLEPSPRR